MGSSGLFKRAVGAGMLGNDGGLKVVEEFFFYQFDRGRDELTPIGLVCYQFIYDKR